jgi:hypothetical protein
VTTAHVPAGWPEGVPPPGAPGWQHRATAWLLDLCPPDYRGYPVLARQPLLLAYLAREHVRASGAGLARARASLRAELSGDVAPHVLDEALAVLDDEEARLRAAFRGVEHLEAALRGHTFVPRL